MIVANHLEDGSIHEYRAGRERIIMEPSSAFFGRSCLFSTKVQAPEAQLYRFDLASGDLNFLTHATFGSWSPGGSLIAAVRADQELVLLDPLARTVEPILSVRPQLAEAQLPWLGTMPPVWSPDGNFVVFSLFRWEGRAVEDKGESGKNEVMLSEQATFVLNIRNHTIIRLPVFCQGWAWRPKRSL